MNSTKLLPPSLSSLLLMSSSRAQDTMIPCGGQNNEHNGCTKLFPRRDQSEPLCNKCKAFDDAESLADEAEVELLRQCDSCGIVGKRITNPCGSCSRALNDEAGIEDVPRQMAASQRAANIASQMKYKTGVRNPDLQPTRPAASSSSRLSFGHRSHVPSNPATHRTMAPPPLSTMGLVLVAFVGRASGLPPAQRNTLKDEIGVQNLYVPGNNTVQDILRRAVDAINVIWNRDHAESLVMQDCELRMPGNSALEEIDLHRPVNEFLKLIQTERPHLWKAPPSGNYAQRAKFSYLYMEVFIFANRWSQRNELVDPEDEDELFAAPKSKFVRASAGGKRKSQSLNSSISRPPSKRVKGRNSGVVLQSTFAPDRPTHNGPAVTVYSRFQFAEIECKIDDMTSQSKLSTVEEFCEGSIAEAPMVLPENDRGLTKEVYMFEYQDERHVAKKVKDIGTPRDKWAELPLEERVSLLEQETVKSFVHIEKLSHFWDRFLKRVHERYAGRDIEPFVITEAFLAKAHSPPFEHPHGSYYLVEPLRTSTSVHHFTGTLGQGTTSNKATNTILAFNHWVLQTTACNLSFADLQGTRSMVDNEMVWVLFDPMVHTVHGGDGLGDHGLEGIKNFAQNHECSRLCNKLALCSMDNIFVTIDELERSQETAAGEEIQNAEQGAKGHEDTGGNGGGDGQDMQQA